MPDTPEILYESELIDGNEIDRNYHQNGEVQRESIHKNGKLDGIETYYYSDGNKRYERTYKDGIMEGPYKEYHFGGILKREGAMKNGKKDGIWKEWWKNGSLKCEWTLKENNYVGVKKHYVDNVYKEEQEKGAAERAETEARILEYEETREERIKNLDLEPWMYEKIKNYVESMISSGILKEGVNWEENNE